jgi:hypothetical protein
MLTKMPFVKWGCLVFFIIDALLSNRLVDFEEILYGSDDDDDIDSILQSHEASTIRKWRTFNLLR